MAICDACGREMLRAKGCFVKAIRIGGTVYPRIPVGGPGDFCEGSSERCGDCNAAPGFYHHWGCDQERCPKCGRQLLSCDCRDVVAEAD